MKGIALNVRCLSLRQSLSWLLAFFLFGLVFPRASIANEHQTFCLVKIDEPAYYTR